MKSKYSDYQLLETGHLQENTTYIHPERMPEVVHLDSPAVDVLTDFKSRSPRLTKPNTLTKNAIELMKDGNVKSLLVIDNDENIIGQVAIRDLEGIKKTQAAQKYGIKPTEVTVNMLMVPFNKVHTLHYKYISGNRVGHIARLFHDLGVYYILVVDDSPKGEMVRGIFSISRVSRALGYSVTGDLTSHSIAEMNKRI